MSITCCKIYQFLGLLLLLSACNLADAVAEDFQPFQLRTNKITAEKLKDLPPGDWVPVPAEKFLQDVKRKQNISRLRKPDDVWISHVIYSATLRSEYLVDGRFDAVVRNISGRNEVLEFSPLNISLRDMKWGHEAARWGTTRAGQTLVMALPGRNALSGVWSTRGKQSPFGLDFHLKLPQATVSLVKLKVPDQYLLKLNKGVLLGPVPSKETGWSIWTLSLGKYSQCEVRIEKRKENNHKVSPLALVSQNTSYVIKQDGLQFQSDYNLEVYREQLQKLEFVVPDELKVNVIAYNDNALQWEILKSTEGFHRILVTLPDGLLGRGRPLRISGEASTQLAKPWLLPRVELINSQFLKGTISLSVDKDLELLELESLGSQQNQFLSTDNARSASYTQENQNAQIIIKLDREQNLIQSQNLIALSFDQESWNLSAELSWSVQSGKQYTNSWLVPVSWQVTEVSHINQGNPEVIHDWQIKRHSDGTVWLTVSFPNSPEVGKTGKILVNAIRPTPTGRLKLIQLPVFIPRKTASLSTCIAVGDTQATLMNLLPSSDFSSINSLGQVKGLSESAWFNKHVQNATMLLFSERMRPQGRILMNSNNGEFTADVTVHGSLQSGTFSEQVVISLQRVETLRSDLVFIYFPKTTNNLIWGVPAADHTKSARAKVISPSRHNLWGLPEKGELWQISLPEKSQREIRLIATQSSTIENEPLNCLLPIVVNASNRTGKYELANNTDDRVTVQSNLTGSEPKLQSSQNENHVSLQTGESRHWRYETADHQLVINRVSQNESGSLRPTARCRMTSRIDPDRLNLVEHVAQIRLYNQVEQQAFTFQLSPQSELISVSVDQRRVSPEKLNELYLVPRLNTKRSQVITLRYRQPVGSADFIQHIKPVIPKLSYEIVEFKWNVELSASWCISESTGLPFQSSSYSSITFWQRVLGPLGRPVENSIFNPLRGVFNEEILPAPNAVFNLPVEDIVVAENSWHYSGNQLPVKSSLIIWNQTRTQYYACICLLIGMLVGALIKLMSPKGGKLALINVAGMAVLIGYWLSEPYVLIIGGLISGLIISSLLPKSLIISIPKKSQIPEGSTVSYSPAAVGGLILLCFSSLGLLQAQEDRSQSKNDPLTPVYDIYLQLENDNGKSEKRYMYIPRELYTLLQPNKSTSTPLVPPLYTHADYELLLNTNGSARLKAKLQVNIHQDSTQTVLNIPFYKMHLAIERPCLVDGKPQNVTLSADKKQLNVELPKPATHFANRTPLAAVKPGHTLNTVRKDPFRSHIIQLDFHLPIKSSGTLNTVDVGVPRMVSSQLTMRSAQNLPELSLANSVLPLQIGTNRRAFQAALDTQDRLQLKWSFEPAPSSEQAERATASILAYYKVFTSYVEAQYAVQCEFAGEVPQLLNWHLPKNSLLQSLDSQQDLDYRINYDSEGEQRLLIVLPQSQSGPFRFQAKLLLPRNHKANQLPLSFPQLFTDVTEMHTVEIKTVKLGAESNSKYYKLNHDLASERISGLETIPFSDLQSDLPKDWAFDKSEVTYRLVEPKSYSVPIQIDVMPIKNTLWSLSHTAIIQQNKCNWKIAAEIETANSHVYQHHLTLDERLKIESIQVIQNEVDRLSHWSRNGPNVVLFLNGSADGFQEIIISASEPLKVPQTLSMPTMLFAEADPVNHSLTIIADHSVEVAVNIKETTETSAITDLSLAQDQYLVGSYQLSDFETAPKMDLTLSSKNVTIDSALLYYQEQNETICELVYRIQPDALHMLQYQPLEIPVAAIYKLDDLEPCQVHENLQWEQELTESEQKILVYAKSKTVKESADPMYVFVKLRCNKPMQNGLPVPEISPEEYLIHNRYLVIHGSMKFKSEQQLLANTITSVALPEWLDYPGESEQKHNRFKAYRLLNQSQDLILQDSSETLQNDDNMSLLTRISLDAQGACYGQTVIITGNTELETLNLSWHESLVLRSLVVNTREDHTVKPINGKLNIPVIKAPHQIIVLDWKYHEEQTVPMLNFYDIHYPLLISDVAAQHAVSILVSNHNRILLKSNILRKMSLEQQLKLWRHVGAILEDQGTENVPDELANMVMHFGMELHSELDNVEQERLHSVDVSRIRDELVSMKATWQSTGKLEKNAYHRLSPNRQIVMFAVPAKVDAAQQNLPIISLQSLDLRVIYSGGIMLILVLVCWLFNKLSSKFQQIPAGWIHTLELVILALIWWWGAIGSTFGFLFLVAVILLHGFQILFRLRKSHTSDQSLSAIQTAEVFE